MDIEEYLEAVNDFAEELYECKDQTSLDALEITVMSVYARYGVEIYLEEWDTG